ncbi:MAG: restriction endonuclease subunit S [Halothiobacillaceae bacterium]
MLIALPPLAEQRRIVAKVDELMALCDRLEGARAGREAVRDRLTAASLARLTTPETDAETFPTHARFALQTLPTLTTRPDQIKTLRQTILNLAVRGKLVEQDPTDEPAAELLKRIVRERKETVARRKIRGATPPKSPTADAEGLSLPASWELPALGQITLITDRNPSHRYPDYSGGTVPILSTREFVGEDGWNPETAKLTTQAFWEFQKEFCDFAAGDIIFARKGRLGLPRFLPPLEKFTFSHTLFSIKPMAGLDPAYLLWLLRRDEVVRWLTNEMNQNTGVPTLGKEKTERLPIPLPPLAEQHRIVAKVDALMALCDQLEASLTTAITTRSRLLEALLHEALGGAPGDQAEAAA